MAASSGSAVDTTVLAHTVGNSRPGSKARPASPMTTAMSSTQPS